MGGWFVFSQDTMALTPYPTHCFPHLSSLIQTTIHISLSLSISMGLTEPALSFKVRTTRNYILASCGNNLTFQGKSQDFT